VAYDWGDFGFSTILPPRCGWFSQQNLPSNFYPLPSGLLKWVVQKITLLHAGRKPTPKGCNQQPLVKPGVKGKDQIRRCKHRHCQRDKVFLQRKRGQGLSINGKCNIFSFFHFCLIKSGAKIKASQNSRQDCVHYAKKFKVPRSAVLQIFLRSAHWSCYREFCKAGPKKLSFYRLEGQKPQR